MIREKGRIGFDAGIVACVIEEGTYSEDRRGWRWGQDKMCSTVRFSS